jgi:hypothetical protein
MNVQADLGEFFVFEVLGMNEFQRRVPKQEWILAVVESPCHFVKVGRADAPLFRLQPHEQRCAAMLT